MKLAVFVVLATTLAWFRKFQYILIFERRLWTDRLRVLVVDDKQPASRLI